MLIRKPVSEVFQAFIDPAITTNFWFTKSSGRLEVGRITTWTWEMYGVSTDVMTKQINPDHNIATDWGNPATSVDYIFKEITHDTTFVVIRNYGFKETGDKLVQTMMDSTGGFTTVLDGLKAYLEHNLKLNLIGDKFPKEVSNYGH